MSQFRKWIDPDNTEKNWATTIYWLILLGILWIFSLILIFDVGITVSSDVTLLLTVGGLKEQMQPNRSTPQFASQNAFRSTKTLLKSWMSA